MKRPLISRMIRAGFLSLLLFAQAYGQTDPSTALGAGPLPSWNDGPAKKASPAQGLPNTRVGTFTRAVRRGEKEGLERDQHEERLETRLRIRVGDECRGTSVRQN